MTMCAPSGASIDSHSSLIQQMVNKHSRRLSMSLFNRTQGSIAALATAGMSPVPEGTSLLETVV